MRLKKYLGTGFSYVLWIYLGCFLFTLIMALILKANLMVFFTTAIHLCGLSVSFYMLAQLGKADALEWYVILMIVGLSMEFVYFCVLFKQNGPLVFIFNMMLFKKDK